MWIDYKAGKKANKRFSHYFRSQRARAHWKLNVNHFQASHFAFKTKSEHTINGKQHDVELQIHHKKEYRSPGYQKEYPGGYSMIGILFSVRDYDRSVTNYQKSVINNFFSDL